MGSGAKSARLLATALLGRLGDQTEERRSAGDRATGDAIAQPVACRQPAGPPRATSIEADLIRLGRVDALEPRRSSSP